MSDWRNDAVVSVVNARANGVSATGLMQYVQELLGERFGPVAATAVLNEAFGIPVYVMQRALGWHGFGQGGNMTDSELEGLLAPWLYRG
ncbi:hypothetical protein ACFPOI_43505 [Nonomuraea angiospora]|uniref:Uncharacterized protein n=1 Tax=Nonomuraea angiospora TaxID=46172 RepID=A0ABR9LV73_9ACTN|nr:hypothetical protein [Nonomuraea angiospora]MBE1584556.1 hypothetical protein [Nonomuraea angiospora]